MDERLLDVVTLSYMSVFLFIFGCVLIAVPRRRTFLDATLTGLVMVLAVSYLRSLLELFRPDVFDTVVLRNAVRVIAMVTVTICVVGLIRELYGPNLGARIRKALRLRSAP